MATIQVDGHTYRLDDAAARQIVAHLDLDDKQAASRDRFLHAADEEAVRHQAAFRALGHEQRLA